MYARKLEAVDSLQTQVPPQCIEAEDHVLGAVMLDPGAFEIVSGMLTAEAFYVGCNREIWKCFDSLFNSGRPTDFLSVTHWLESNNLLEKIGGRNRLAQLLESCVGSVNVDYKAELIIEMFRRRQMISLGYKIAQMGFDKSEELSSLIEIMQKDVYEFGLKTEKPNYDNEHLGDVALELYGDTEKMVYEQQAPGIATGFYDFDTITGGLLEEQLVLIAARPAIGKSSIAQDIAWYTAHTLKKPTFFYSLEMSKKQLAMRWAAKVAGIELSYLKLGKLSTSQWADYARAIETMTQSKLFLNDASDIDISKVKSSIRKSVSRTGEAPGLIVVDYLQLLAGVGDGDGDDKAIYQQVTNTSRRLKQLAREFKCPVIALSQLSRKVESRNNKRPILSDLRESGALEQDADIVTFLYRDEYYNPDSSERGLAEWIVGKHRDGPTGTIKLLFDAQFTQFKNLARSQY